MSKGNRVVKIRQIHNYLETLLNEILKKRVNGGKRLSFEASLFLKFYDNFVLFELNKCQSSNGKKLVNCCVESQLGFRAEPLNASIYARLVTFSSKMVGYIIIQNV